MEDPKSWTAVEHAISAALDHDDSMTKPFAGLSRPRRIADALRKAELVLPEAPGVEDLYRQVEELPVGPEVKDAVRRLVNAGFMRGWRDSVQVTG